MELSIKNINEFFIQLLKHSKLQWALVFCSTTIFVLLFLRPFGINYAHFDAYYFLLISGYGVLGFIPAIFYEMWISRFFITQKFIPFIIGSFLLLLIISVLVWGYGNFLHNIAPQYSFPPFSFGKGIISTFSIGVIPLSIRAAYFISRKKIKPPEIIHLFSADKKDWIRIDANSLIYLKACDNYVEINFLINDKKLNKRLLRNTLKNIEIQLNNAFFIRCHRSFIINSQHIAEVKGNKKGLEIKMINLDILIPVARSKVNLLKRNL